MWKPTSKACSARRSAEEGTRRFFRKRRPTASSSPIATRRHCTTVTALRRAHASSKPSFTRYTRTLSTLPKLKASQPHDDDNLLQQTVEDDACASTAARSQQDSFLHLEQASRVLLSQQRPAASELEAILEEWHTAVSSSTFVVLPPTALERIHDVWQAWWHDSLPKQSSSRPFEILVLALADHADSSNASIAAPQALQVFRAWAEGDCLHAAERIHYNALLKTHAVAAVAHLQDGQQPQDNYNDMEEQDGGLSALQTADMALEVIDMLQEWGNAMSPNAATYAYAIQCLAPVVHAGTLTASGNRRLLVKEKSSSGTTPVVDSVQGSGGDPDSGGYQDHFVELMNGLLQQVPRQSRAASSCATTKNATGLLSEVLDRLLPHLEDRQQRQNDPSQPMQTNDLSGTEKLMLLQSMGQAMQCFDGSDRLSQWPGWKAWADDWNDLLVDSASELSQCLERNQDGVAWLDPCTTAAQTIYNHVLQGKERAEALERTVANLEALSVDWLPMTHHYNLGIQAWVGLQDSGSNGVHVDGHKQLDDLLQRMQDQHVRLIESDTLEQAGITKACNSLMIGHLDAGSTDGMMSTWKDMATTWQWHRDSLSFSIALKALAHESSRSPDAAMQAHSIWKKLVNADESQQHVHPHRQHYGWVMVAWSKSRNKHAVKYCQEVFDRLEEEARVNPKMTPDVVHYSALITTLGWSRDPGAVKKVLSIFLEMKAAGIEPDLAAYSAVLATLSRIKSVEGAERAQSILNELEELSTTEGKEHLRPNIQCYTSAIFAWARSGSPDASIQSGRLYGQLREAYERSNQHPALLPNNVVFRALVEAELRSGRRDAGDRAITLLDRVEKFASEGSAEYPDSQVYTKVMQACSWKSKGPKTVAQTEAVFERMKEAYRAGNSAAKPDTHSMIALMQAWANSNAPDKATHTWNMLSDMCDAYQQGDLDMQPTVHAFAAVLNACAFTSSRDPRLRQEAIEIAWKTMNELDESVDGPNEVTFRDLFRVIGSLVDDMPERTRMASTIFQRCCQEGCVSPWVISTIRRSVPLLYKKLPFDANKNLRLPPDWTRNAVAKASSNRATA